MSPDKGAEDGDRGQSLKHRFQMKNRTVDVEIVDN
jgi:hypothetical protein